MVMRGGNPVSPPRQAGESWWHEHSELGHLVEALVEAVSKHGTAAASAALAELTDAMEAHFSIVEELYFPLMQNLRPGLRAAISRAGRLHGTVRGNLRELAAHLADRRLREAQDMLIELLAQLRLHEQEEARLIADLRAVQQV